MKVPGVLKALKFSTAAVVLFSLMLLSFSHGPEIAVAQRNGQAVPDVFPTPRQLEVTGEGFPITPVVGVFTNSNADPQAVSELEEILRIAGVKQIKYYTENDQATSAPVTFWIGPLEENSPISPVAESLGVKNTDKIGPEGYLLASGENSDGKKTVLLAGKDPAGTFYAVQTLRQLIIPHDGMGWMPAVEVKDWPQMRDRGAIEGFYGPPWSHNDRLNQLDFYGKNKMNMYIYAPKDDPYHREKWRDPYPAEKMADMKELVQKASQNHIEFVFAISPGQTVCYSDDSDFEKLAAKAQAVWDIGVRSFAIFLDDIDPSLRCQQDKEKFGQDPNPPAAAQAFLLNRFKKEFLDVHPSAKPLITVPTDYWQADTTPYRERFADLVDPSIVVQWTGIGVVAPTITAEDAEKISAIFKHDLLIWDNYPVNDYARNRLFLGPLVGRDPDLTDHGVVGLTANPMNEAEASKIPLFTIADYVWNSRAYNPERSWEHSIKRFGGSTADALRTFAENSYSSPINSTESLTVKPLIEQFWKAFSEGKTEEAAKPLTAEFSKIEKASGTIRNQMENRKFVEEAAPYLDKLELYSKAGQTAVTMLIAQEKNDGNAAWLKRLELEAFQENLKKIPQQMAPGVFDNFIHRAIEENDSWFGAKGIYPTSTMGTYSSYSLSNMMDGNESTLYWTDQAPRPGDAIGVNLGDIRKVDGIELLMGSTTGPVPRPLDYVHQGVLEYSTDGKQWTEITPVKDQPEIRLQLTEPIEAKYIRLRVTASQQNWLQVREFKVNGDLGQVEVTGAPPAASGSSLGAASDGKVITAYRAEREPGAGEALTFKLWKSQQVKEIIVLQDPVAPAKAAVQILDEAGEWKTVGEIENAYNKLNVGATTDHIRLLWKTTSIKPVIYEVIANN